jgi:hypothetical protein
MPPQAATDQPEILLCRSHWIGDECLRLEVFFIQVDARRKLALWINDHNHHRPHSALADRTPAEFAAICSDGKGGDKAALENATRFPLSHRTTATTSISLTDLPISSPCLKSSLELH